MREAIKDITVSDEEAKRFYDEHPDQFKNPERVHARHILLNDDAESADKLARVQADLKAGVSFDKIAKEVSVCPSAPQGGDLGEFQKGQMVPEFEAAAFALKNPGDISEPVKTQFGWHIIRLEGRVPESAQPFDEVKAQITQELHNTKASDRIRARIDEMKKKYKVEILDTGKEPEKK
ncbi:MAG: peptidyl-prolyl cis-trans isomerase [Fretibacterium sp.]|nr:peptidyl-prolyl cis-trans isomerase [Fretibacterium sp.]